MSDQPAVRTRRRGRVRQRAGFARRAVVRRPGVLLGLLAAVTVVFGGLATQLEVDTDTTRFAVVSPMARGLERIEEDFDVPDGAQANAAYRITLAGAEPFGLPPAGRLVGGLLLLALASVFARRGGLQE